MNQSTPVAGSAATMMSADAPRDVTGSRLDQLHRLNQLLGRLRGSTEMGIRDALYLQAADEIEQLLAANEQLRVEAAGRAALQAPRGSALEGRIGALGAGGSVATAESPLEIRVADTHASKAAEYPVFLVSGSTTVAEVWGVQGAKHKHAERLAQAWNERDGLLAKLALLEQEAGRLRSACEQMYAALEDASTVVDKSPDEDYAYQAELGFGADALGYERQTPARMKG